jgi:hypothetical protein
VNGGSDGPNRRPGKPQRTKESAMELQMRLNVLAVLLSLGFLAAIVFGMI